MAIVPLSHGADVLFKNWILTLPSDTTPAVGSYGVLSQSGTLIKSTVDEMVKAVLPAPGEIGGTTPAVGTFSRMTINGIAAVAGSGNISTVGSSTTATVPAADYSSMAVGTTLYATVGGQTRYVVALLGSNQVTIDMAMDWTGGVAYTHQAPADIVKNGAGAVVRFTAPNGTHIDLNGSGVAVRSHYYNIPDVFYGGISSDPGGTSNERFGSSAFVSRTTANYSTAVGQGALNKLTTGGNSTAVGYVAGEDITTGVGNTAIGSQALRNTTVVDYNLAVGLEALATNTSGSSNTAVGSYDVMLYNETGGLNVAVGRAALSVGTSPDNTVAVGYAAGQNMNGDNNIAIGYTAGAYETGSNKLFIDSLDRTNEATARTNSIIYGVMNATPANSTLALNAAVTGLNIGASDYKVTVGAGTGITVNNTGTLNSQLYKVTTTYAAYSDSDTKKGIVIATLPAKTKLVGVYSDTTAAYTGGTVSAATLVVGVTVEDGAEIIASHNVFAGAVTKGLADADMGTSMTRAAQIQGGYLPSWSGTTAIYATINTTDGNTSVLTAGSTTFYLVTERF